jgi:hypothetical protein
MGGAGAGIVLHEATQRPPFEVSDARVSGQLWVMPGTRVPAFLRSHEAPAARGSFGSQPVVVGRVAWASHPDAGGEDRFTVLLGDDNGGAGYVQQVLGRPDDDVSLGNGSMWARAIARNPWLRGSLPVRLDSGGVTEYGIFASLPTSTRGDLWFVGQVLDTPRELEQRQVVADARPVVGVALSTGSHVWWVTKVASAP